MPLMSICLVKVFARFIHRREAVEKLVESKVAVPFLLKSWRSDDPIGSTISFLNGVLSSLPGILENVQSLSMVPSGSSLRTCLH